jgi:hypothetical protein
MADDIASLGFSVDSSQARAATTDLNNLSKAASGVAGPTRAIEEAAKRAGVSADEMRARIAAAGAGAKGLGGDLGVATAAVNATSAAAVAGSRAQDQLGNSLSQTRATFRLLAREAGLVGGPLGSIIRDTGTLVLGGQRLSIGLTAGVIGFSALTAAVTLAVSEYAKFEAQQAKVTNALAATGRAGKGQTAGGIEGIVQGAAASGTQSTSDIRAATLDLLKFRDVSAEIFPEVLSLAKDVAATGFADLKTATEDIGKALKDPTQAGEQFAAMGLKLSDAAQLAANKAAGMGDKAGAARIILKELSDQVGGSDARAADTLSAAWGRLSNETLKASENFGQAIASAIGLKGAIDGLAGALKTYNDMVERNNALSKDFQLTGKFRTPEQMKQGPGFREGLSDDLGFNDIGAKNKLGSDLGLDNIEKTNSAANALAERTARAAAETEKLRQAWGGVSAEEAKVLQGLQDQLTIASARTPQEKAAAEAAVAESQARLSGATAEESAKEAALQRALTAAQTNKSLDDQLAALKQQEAVLRGASELDQVRLKAAQDYDKAVAEGGDSLKAGAVASQTIANARMAQDARDTSQSWSVMHDQAVLAANAANALAVNTEDAAIAAHNYRMEMEKAARGPANVLFGTYMPVGMDPFGVYAYTAGKDAWDNFTTQFNPAGYSSTIGPNPNAMATSLGGPARDPKTGLPTSEGITALANNILGKGGSVTDAINKLLGGSGGFGSTDDGRALAALCHRYAPDAPRVQGVCDRRHCDARNLCARCRTRAGGDCAAERSAAPIGAARRTITRSLRSHASNLYVNVTAVTRGRTRDEARKTGFQIAQEMKRRLA